MREIIRALLVAAAILGGVASAHEGGTHRRGVVQEIAKDRLVLAVEDGKPLTYVLGPGTRIRRSGRSVPVEEIRAGERAIVHAQQVDGRLEATEVKLGAAPGSPRGGSATP